MKEIAFRHMPELSYAGNEAINTLCTNLTFSGENIKKILLSKVRRRTGFEGSWHIEMSSFVFPCNNSHPL
jgi:hypothetical protein